MLRRNLFSAMLSSVALVSFMTVANATTLSGDAFSYVGDLNLNGWSTTSGAGNKVIASDGSVATLEQSGGSGEDIRKDFTAQTATAKTYSSMLVTVNSTASISNGDLDANGLYFTGLTDAGFAFRSRVFVANPVAGGDFTFGLDADDSSVAATFAGDFSFDTQYKIVSSYDATTGAAELWVDPIDELSAKIIHDTVGEVSAGTEIAGIFLRQSNDYTGFLEIDNVGVGSTFATSMIPEPASVVLLFAGLLGMGAVRRK